MAFTIDPVLNGVPVIGDLFYETGSRIKHFIWQSVLALNN